MSLAPPTIDRVALVRLRLRAGKCPGCGAAQQGRRVCCSACTAEGLRYCPACEAVVPTFRASRCPACYAAHRRARYQADVAAGRAAQAHRRRVRSAREGHTVQERGAQLAELAAARRRTALRWACGETTESLAAELGITVHALRQRWGRQRRAQGVTRGKGARYKSIAQ